MAKLRRNASRPSSVKKAKAPAPATRTKGKPAVETGAESHQGRAKEDRHARAESQAEGAHGPAPAQHLCRCRSALRARTPGAAGQALSRSLRHPQARDRRVPRGDRAARAGAALYIRVCERRLAPLNASPQDARGAGDPGDPGLERGVGRAGHRARERGAPAERRERRRGVLLGVALASKGDRAGALQHLARALTLNPDSRDAMFKEPGD